MKSKVVAPVARAKGGKAAVVSGNPKVLKEAGEGGTGDEDKVGRKTGGKVKMLRMSGGSVAARRDRAGRFAGGQVVRRKSGGSVGANRTPFSTAHSSTSQDAGSSSPSDTYGGMPK